MIPSPATFWQSTEHVAPQIVVLTGDMGAGKTGWCAELAAYVKALGLRVAGLLSPAVFDAGQKTAIDVLDLASGRRQRLAVRRSAPDSLSTTPNWQFDGAVLAWGDAVLGALGACDLLVIDELGPLELIHRQGWQQALPLLAKQQYQAACVVVRQSLTPIFCERFPTAKVLSLN
jgi:nucleoside-triphosphatase THEP1